MTLKQIEPGTLCEHCGENPATGVWIGDGGMLAVTRSYMQAVWCERCMLSEQVKTARKGAAALPRLEQRLAKLGGPPSPAAVKRTAEVVQRAKEAELERFSREHSVTVTERREPPKPNRPLPDE